MPRRALLAVAALLVVGIGLSPAAAVPSGAAPSYARYLEDATAFPEEAEFDYVVVGGGTSGCPLAATLAAGSGTRRRVLVLERGGAPREFPELATVGGFLHALQRARGAGAATPVEAFVSEDGVPNVRARVLGGGSAVNAGFYSRAHPDWFLRPHQVHHAKASPWWWDMDLVNKSYAWVEDQVAFQPAVRGWQVAVRDALLQANVTPWNEFTVDHVVGTKVGATTFDVSGRRHSAADLLVSAPPGTLGVALRATAARLLIHPIPPGSRHGRSPQATMGVVGVIYQDRLGRVHRAMLRPGGEVILCAGALGSPQLLLLSGIGPASMLSSFSIPIVIDNRDVGRHVFDNPRNGISFVPSVPLDTSLIQVVGIPATDGSASYLEAASYVVSFMPTAHISTSLFIHRPSVPLHVAVATIMEKVPGPSSEGSLWLTSLNPMSAPSVRFNYFQKADDLARCVAGVRRVAALLESPAMDGFRSTVGWWGRRVPRREFRFVGPVLPLRWRTDDTAVEDFCRRTVTTLWHYHGGCIVGKGGR